MSFDFDHSILVPIITEIPNLFQNADFFLYTRAPIVGIPRWSVPRIGKGHLEVKW